MLVQLAHNKNTPEYIQLRVIGYLGPKRRVLVVDDDSSQRQLITDLLKPLGFDVLQAAEARTGMGILANNKIHLMILDVRMPEIDGWTMAKQIREQQYNMPVLMVSANARDADTNLAADGHHNGYIAKPVNLDALLGKIGELLSIKWQFEHKDQTTHVHEIIQSKPPIHKEQYQELIALAEIGYLSGFKDKLDKITEHYHVPADILSQLLEYVKFCNFPEIIKYLEEISHEQ
ncbi:response regulator [Paraglaciecola aquimarina]|uniref:Response regulator n=1 Tax=Paraglaciecola aquimarina TaxID=1235557 RepID=A0ABU3SVU5_9ALTE|nr:response regulator [Paraglaciecola aquimarina]MDU0354136.1 response regulator [Paraglaciecola aquimarina]